MATETPLPLVNAISRARVRLHPKRTNIVLMISLLLTARVSQEKASIRLLDKTLILLKKSKKRMVITLVKLICKIPKSKTCFPRRRTGTETKELKTTMYRKSKWKYKNQRKRQRPFPVNLKGIKEMKRRKKAEVMTVP